MALKHYLSLALLFEYPKLGATQLGFANVVLQVRDGLPNKYNEAKLFLDHFQKSIALLSEVELEEIYTRTFDVQALTTLDIGYVLFGDDYKRGKLLSHLNREHNKAHNDCGTELADHLPNVLRLLSTWDHYELTQDFIQFILAPALRKMIGEFDIENLNSKEKFYKKAYKTLIDSVQSHRLLYLFPLQALYAVIQKDFEVTESLPQEKKSDFLESILKEFETEERGEGV